MVTADIPMIRPEVIDDFLDRCSELEGDIYYPPIVSKEASEQVYPEVVRTYFTLKEGTFTGGNILLAAPEAILDSKWILDELIFERKNLGKSSGTWACTLSSNSCSSSLLYGRSKNGRMRFSGLAA